VVYVNVLLYLWVGYALVRTAWDAYAMPHWNAELAGSRLFYVGLRIFAAFYTAVCVSGLLRRTPWSRGMAFWWNLALAVIIGGFPPVTALWLAVLGGESATEALRSTSLVVGSLAALVFLVLSIALRTRGLRAYFAPAQDSNLSAAVPRS